MALAGRSAGGRSILLWNTVPIEIMGKYNTKSRFVNFFYVNSRFLVKVRIFTAFSLFSCSTEASWKAVFSQYKGRLLFYHSSSFILFIVIYLFSGKKRQTVSAAAQAFFSRRKQLFCAWGAHCCRRLDQMHNNILILRLFCKSFRLSEFRHFLFSFINNYNISISFMACTSLYFYIKKVYVDILLQKCLTWSKQRLRFWEALRQIS